MLRRRAALAALVLLPVVAGGFLAQDRAQADGVRLLDQVFALVSQRFVDSLGSATLYEKAARGVVKELNDPYSELFSPKELATFSQATNGKYAGIGMQIQDLQGAITVSTVFPHTPAEAGGVRERGWTSGCSAPGCHPGSRACRAPHPWPPASRAE